MPETPKDPSDKRILLGHIAGAHGLKGEVLIKSYTETPEDIAAYGPLEDERGTRRFVIRALRMQGKNLVARLEGICDRTAAEGLRGVKLYVDRAHLPEPEEDAWYHADLIGLLAEDRISGRQGEIIAVHDYGAGPLLEIRFSEDGKSVLIPFTRETVPEIDMARGRAVVAVPPGLMA